VLDAHGRVYRERLVDRVPQGKPQHLPELDGTIAMTAEHLLKGGGELWVDGRPHAQKLLDRSDLVALVGRGPCGLDGSGSVRCVDAAPAGPGRGDDRVLLEGITSASAYESLFVGVDAAGNLHCAGSNWRDLCGPPAGGIAESAELLVVPLR
jgi:hypothetical protein